MKVFAEGGGGKTDIPSYVCCGRLPATALLGYWRNGSMYVSVLQSSVEPAGGIRYGDVIGYRLHGNMLVKTLIFIVTNCSS